MPQLMIDYAEKIHGVESEVKSLEAAIKGLRSEFCQKEPVLSDKVTALLAENQKLKYRLNILKRAAANMDAPTSQNLDDSKSLYSILKVLTDVFDQAIKTAFPDIANAPVNICLANPTMAAAKGFDYQCNSALPIFQSLKARGVKTKPSEVGEKITAALPPHPIVEKVDVAPAGFINVYLNRSEVKRQLSLLLEYGVQPPNLTNKQLRVVVDFSSPNIAKEMHVGHLRSTIIGDSICRLLEFLGHDVLRINHIGDWGTQFGMLIAHLQDTFPNYKKVSPPVSDLQAFYRASKVRFDEDPEFKKRAYACVVKLQSYDPDHIKAWQLICDVSRKEFQKVYDRLGIKLIERGESFYQKKMVQLVEELSKKEVLQVDDGRKILWCKAVSVPFTIIKSDGGFTYDTSDLATIKQRLEEERADWLIYVTDAGQEQHFEILKHCSVELGYLDPKRVRMDHVSFGAVLGEDGKKFKTRSGETVKLVELLDEGLRRALEKLKEKGREKVLTPEELDIAQRAVAYGCIKYADLSHNRTHQYVFSFDKMLDDKGNTAAYLLYALTRIRSIARLAGVTPEQLNEASKTTPISLEHEREYKLGKVILRFGEVLDTVCSTLCLHPLCDYVYEVSVVFSEFYDVCYCVEKNASGEIIKINMGRLLLTEITARMLEKCFYILGVEPVTKM